MLKIKPLYSSYWFYIVIFIYISWQLATLSFALLPWFDETFFASISLQFAQEGTFNAPVAVFTEEVKLYGPIYFLCNALSFKILGFGIFQFRLTNFIFSLLVIWQSTLILKFIQPQASKEIRYLLIILMAIDPFFWLCQHEGRMDLMAVGWFLLGLLCLLKGFKYLQISYFVFSGLVWALALLTTPRSGFLVLAGLIYGLFWVLSHKNGKFKYAFAFGFSLALPYLIWILYAFGGINEFVNYFLGKGSVTNREESFYSLFLGWNGYIPRQTYGLIIIAIILIIKELTSKKALFFDAFNVIALMSIGLFYGMVFDYGPYSIFILPFYYLLIFRTLDNIYAYKNLASYLLFFLFIHHLAFFILKSSQVLANAQQFDYQAIDNFIARNIPPKSRVVGEPKYYYSVVKSGSFYQYNDLYETLELREKIQREQWNYQYIIISDQQTWRNPEVVKYYLQKRKIKKIARFEIKPTAMSLFINRLKIISDVERDGYNGSIYQVIDNQ
jgi:4-amino-4-deoxy-L-arabinose transferase-like glycosyltransferase